MKEKSRIGLFGSIKMLTVAAMLAAVSAVIGIVCKNLFTFNIYYRITFENLPVILSGILFGPIIGGAVGGVADIISCICSTNPAVNPLITAGAVCVGVSSGVLSHYVIRKRGLTQVTICVFTAHLLGQVIIKSAAKILFLGMPWWGAFIGLGISAAAGTAEIFLINYILSRQGIMKLFNGNIK